MLYAVQVSVRFEAAVRKLYDSCRDVGAVIGYPLKVTQQIGKGQPLLNGARSALQAFYMVLVHFRRKLVNDLLERLGVYGKQRVVV